MLTLNNIKHVLTLYGTILFQVTYVSELTEFFIQGHNTEIVFMFTSSTLLMYGATQERG